MNRPTGKKGKDGQIIEQSPDSKGDNTTPMHQNNPASHQQQTTSPYHDKQQHSPGTGVYNAYDKMNAPYNPPYLSTDKNPYDKTRKGSGYGAPHENQQRYGSGGGYGGNYNDSGTGGGAGNGYYGGGGVGAGGDANRGGGARSSNGPRMSHDNAARWQGPTEYGTEQTSAVPIPPAREDSPPAGRSSVASFSAEKKPEEINGKFLVCKRHSSMGCALISFRVQAHRDMVLKKVTGRWVAM